MFSDDKWYLLTEEEKIAKHSRIQEGVKVLERASAFDTKPNAPFVNLGNLKSLVKELLDKHFKKIAITTAISLVVSGIFTWLVWPKSESEVVREAKAETEKMAIELQKAKEETTRLAKEKEELLAEKTKESEPQKQNEAQNVKNEVPESKNEKKEKESGDVVVVGLGFFIGFFGFCTLGFVVHEWMVRRRWACEFIFLTVLSLSLTPFLIVHFWPRSENTSEAVEKSTKAPAQTTNISAEKSKPTPRKFISRATITFKETLFDKYNNNYFFYLKLDNGRKGKLQIDSKFFALVKVGEIIAIYEDDKFLPEEKPKKKRVEY